MSEPFQLIRVFLASPGGLQDERRLAYEAIKEINKGIAAHFNYIVELDGWEDTLSGSGRPQEIINQDLDRCELFIGIMWRKWGTPPDIEGTYSSGFEEEFDRSFKRYKDTKKPEMAMYFKEIPLDSLDDPGEDLKKVIMFRDRLISEKFIYFETFKEPINFQECVRKKITQYLLNLDRTETENEEEVQAKTKQPSGDVDAGKNKEPLNSLFLAEGRAFLKSFLEKTDSEDDLENITSIEVARFRLLSNSISKAGNDEPFLGVHDSNIIYTNKQIDFGYKEISQLIDCGLKNFRHSNAPLWHWYKVCLGVYGEDFISFRSLLDNDVGVGALEVMNLIGQSLPIEEDVLDRNFFISNWLSVKSSDNKKNAALSYLKHQGKGTDLPQLQSELDREDSKTSRTTLETIVNIQFRDCKGDALKTIFANQFESFDEIILEDVLSVPLSLDEETLKLGLKHKNKKVRNESFRRLREGGKIISGEIKELKNDPYALIRKGAVDYLLSSGQSLSDEEVKNIIVKPQKRGGLFAPTLKDEEGQACYDEYLFSKYSDMSEKELLEIVKENSIFDEPPYLALCSRYFKKHSEVLRKNIDDKFKGAFEAQIESFKNMGVIDKSIERAKNLEDFARKKLTRTALNILCKKGDIRDLHRIRENMRLDYVNSSIDEIEYMRKQGEWEDIPFIIKAKNEYVSFPTSLMILSINFDWERSISNAIYSIGKDRLDELLKIEMPSRILANLIKDCSYSKFSEMPDELLLNLMNKKEDNIRKYTALKSIQSLKKSRLATLLKKYSDGEEYRYYNVIVWLDFGIAMPKSITGKATKIVFEE